MATYYVDATNGDDSKDGLSEANAWQTIGKVNGAAFSAGDSILFKRGETWTGTMLNITWSGASGSPIIFGAYGSGALPVIDGNDLIDCVNITGRSYITLEDIEAAQGLNFSFHISNSTNIHLVDCVGRDCGNSGVDFNTGASDCTVRGGAFHDTYQRVGGATCAGIGIQDGCHDIEVTEAACYDGVNAATHGITIHNHIGTTFPYNITLRRCFCYGNQGNGIQIRKFDANVDGDRNILIEDCRIYDNDVHGIYAFPGGAQQANGVTIRRCLLERNGNRCLYMRGDNFSVYNNVIIGDVSTPVNMSGCVDTVFWNNTMYQTAAVPAGGACFYADNARTSSLVVKNNIMYADNVASRMINIAAGTGVVGIDIDYNLYSAPVAGTEWLWLGVAKNWANWLADSGQDANSPAPADPQFIDDTIDNLKLKRGSPGLGVGVDVGLIYHGSAPDCGRWEGKWLSQRAHAL